MSLQKVGVQLTADGADAFNRALADGDKAVAGFGKSAATAGGQVSGFGQIATGALRELGAIAVNAGLQGIKALGGFVQAGISGAADLQQSVANISTIKPEINTSAVFASLNEMQTRVPQTAAQLGESLYNIFSSVDVSQQDALQLTEQFAKGAVGAGTDAETFGTAVLGVMNAYKLGVGDASHISDVFFNTIRDGVVTGSELASSLGPVTQAARSAGVDLNTLGGFIAGVTKEGGPAAQNINNLNNFLQKITTEKAQGQLAKLGVATTDATGAFRPVPAILGDLKARLGDMTEAERNNALQAIFPDAQARQGAQTLISQLDFVNKAIESNQETTGSAAAAYEKMSATFQSQSALAKNALLGFGMTIGAAILPSLTSFISSALIPGVQWLQNFTSVLLSSSHPFETLLAVIDGALPSLSSLTALVGNVVTAFGTGGLSGALDALGASLPAVGQMLLGFGQQFLSWIGPLASQALTALGGFAASVGAWILQQAPIWGAQLLSWGMMFADFVTPYIGQALTALGTFAASVGSWIVQQAPQWAAQLLTWGEQFVNWVSPYISQALGKLGEFVSAAWQWVQQQAPTWLANLEAWGVALYQWVEPQVALLLGKLGDLASSVWAWVAEQAPILLSKLEAWGQSMINWVEPQIAPLLAQAGALASSFIGWIGEQAAPILDKLGTWASSFIAWIGPATVNFLKEWPGMLSQFLDWIGGAAGPILLKLGEWALQFTAWIVPMIPGFIVGLGAIALALITFVGETVVTLAGKLLEWSTAFGAWIGADLVPKLPGLLTAITDSIGTWITGTAVPWLTSAAGALGTAIIDGIKSMVSAGGKAVSDAISSVISGALAAAKNLFGISSPSTVFADEVGQPIVAGIQFGMLNEMPNLLAAMRGSLDSTIQEIVSFVDGGPGETLNQAGADAINAFIAGMSQAASPTGFVKKLTDQLGTGTGMTAGTPDTTGLWQPTVDATKQAWDQIHLGVTDQITATKDAATQIAGQLGTDAANAWLKLATDTAAQFGQIHLGITSQITGAKTDSTTQTGLMSSLTLADWQKISTDTATQFGQVHTDITTKIADAKTKLGLATGAMQTGTATTFGKIATDAKTNWDTAKTNITTPVGDAKTAVATDSGAMQQSMIIPLQLQSQIEGTYTSVADAMIKQLGRVQESLNKLYNTWVALLNLPKPSAPKNLGGGGTPPDPGIQFDKRASGGPVFAGMSYMVGERGRELFTPNVNGYVLPASVTQQIAPPASPQQIAHASYVSNNSTTNHFNVTGNYRYEDPQTITQKVRTMAMLYGSTT